MHVANVSQRLQTKTNRAKLIAVSLVLAIAGGLYVGKTARAGGGACFDTEVPIAYFSLSPADKGVSTLDVAVDASSSTGCGDTIASYDWDFGDGHTTTGVLASHQFGVGSFDIVLTVTNQNGASDTYTDSVNIKADNQNPVINNIETVAFHQYPVTVDMTAQASDPDGDDLANRFYLVGADNTGTLETEKGKVSYSYDTGVYEYHPKEYYGSGQDMLEVRVEDGYGGSATATITINLETHVTGVDDSASTYEDKPVVIDVLTNDYSYYGEPVEISSSTYENIGGYALVNADSTVTFYPSSGFVGTGSFKYVITSSDPYLNGVNYAHAYIEVQPNPNEAPTVNDDALSVNEDSSASLDVTVNDSDSDGDSFTASLVSGPGNGTASLSADGTLNYAPNSNYFGSDSVTYQLTDSEGNVSAIANVSITVNSVNDLPVAGDDAASVMEDADVIINVLANDADLEDGVNLSVEIVNWPQRGNATVNVDGSITYSPEANYFGGDSFTYNVTDSDGGSAQATVSAVVNSVNDGPSASFSWSINNGGQASLDASRSSDIDGQIVSYAWDFGDGQTATTTSNTISHKYKGKGPFNVTLTVTDNEGATATYSETINK